MPYFCLLKNCQNLNRYNSKKLRFLLLNIQKFLTESIFGKIAYVCMPRLGSEVAPLRILDNQAKREEEELRLFTEIQQSEL